jgi:hypothetical protein
LDLAVAGATAKPVIPEDPIKAPDQNLQNFVIEVIIHNNGANLPYLVKQYCRYHPNVKSKALYYRLRRLLFALKKQGVIDLIKQDGMLFAKPTPQTLHFEAKLKVDLIKRACKTQTLQKRHFHETKFKAMSLLQKCKVLDERKRGYLHSYFFDYLIEVGRKVLVFEDLETGEWLVKPYRHRFLDSELKKKRRQFSQIWDALSSGAKEGVFLTITHDPKDVVNLLSHYKTANLKFNRFMSWVTKKLGFRPNYLKVVEFHESGLVHFHVILFGIKRLADKFTQITPELEKIGFGKISFLYSIRKIENGDWVWVKSPKDAKRRNPKGYLMKYLAKSTSNYQKDLALFFASNLRFFSFSYRVLKKDFSFVVEVRYIFIGSFHVLELPDFLVDEVQKFLAKEDVKWL